MLFCVYSGVAGLIEKLPKWFVYIKKLKVKCFVLVDYDNRKNG